MQPTIAIIGGGNLGASLAEGLLEGNFVSPANLYVTRRNLQSLFPLQQRGVHITDQNLQAINNAQYIVLAVKPFQLKEVLEQLQPALQADKHVLISLVTGVWIHEIREIVGNQLSVFRAMPNTAIAIRESMTCICSTNATAEQIDFVSNLFNQLGKSVHIEEKLMDAATVLGACGTAFAMRYIRANIQGGIEIGFSAATASLIAAQTVKGAATLLLTKNTHPEQEIDKVTTPKGCTIAGLNEMEHQGFSSSLIKGVVTSYRKIQNDM